jgi:hypothetical protein
LPRHYQPHYQWRKNDAPITGANASDYDTPPTSSNDNGAKFSVIVSNDFGKSTSDYAALTVNSGAGPQIDEQPKDQIVTAPAKATFSVQASGTGTLSYRWFRDETEISDTNSSSYQTPATTTGDNGVTFSVEVKDDTGKTATSDSALLTVAPTWTDLYNIFGPSSSANCGSCHTGGQTTTTFSMADESTAYTNLVTVKAVEQCSQTKRVDPSKPDNSYLINKLDGTQCSGSRMPPSGNALSSSELKAWIKAGALNN